jgi:hypothetical protein
MKKPKRVDVKDVIKNIFVENKNNIHIVLDCPDELRKKQM